LKPSKNTSSKSPRDLVMQGLHFPLIKEDDVQDVHIKKALAQVYAIVGLHPDYFPKAEVNQMLINYIREQMADLSLRDLINAFVLGVQKKLQAKDRRGNLQPVNVDPNYNFSIRFLEEVIQAYREYRKPFVREYNEAKQIKKKPKWTIHDKIETYVEQYKRHLSGKPVMDFGNVIFKTLRDDIGFLRVSDEEIKERATEAIASGKKQDEMGLGEFVNKLSSRKGDSKFPSAIAAEKTKAVEAFFTELKEQEISVTDFKEMLEDKLL